MTGALAQSESLPKSDRSKLAEYPALSLKERDRRWGRVKELMKTQGLECLVVFGLKGREQFARYLTNDRTAGITIFPLDGELVQLTWATFDLTAHLESNLRGEATWVQDMRLGAYGPGVVEVLREKGYAQANIGVVGPDDLWVAGEMEGYVPYKTWAYVLKNLSDAKFHYVSNAFAQLIFVKSDEELKLVHRAAEIGELAAEAMMNVVRPGVSESKIYAAIMDQLYENGGCAGFSRCLGDLILHSGPDNPSWGAPTWLLRGQPPRMVTKGDIVHAEIFPHYAGMEAQLQMCIAIEPLDPVNRECAEIARRSYEIGLKALRPGRMFGEVVKEMGEPLRQAGAWHLTPLIHSLNPLCWVSGTGVGIENLPGIKNYKGMLTTPVIGAELFIQANTVWELEPNACFGKHRVNIGGTVIVTEGGAVALNMLPTEMRIVG